LRDASGAVDEQVKAAMIEEGMREDLFKAVLAARKDTDESKLSPEDKRLAERLERDFRRNGLALSEDKRARLTEIQKRLAKIGIDFQQRLNEDTTSITCTREELAGCTDDWIQGLKKTEDGKYIVTVKYPDLIPTLKLCQVEETRKRLQVANDGRCSDNTALLEEALALRREAASIQGYKNHAAYMLEIKMAKTPEAVMDFLNDLRSRLRELGEKDRVGLLEVKRAEMKRLGKPFDGILHPWDKSYYERIQKETEFQIDDEAIKQYFSLHSVTEGMLRIYETVLGLKFTEVEKPESIWHPDVRMFEVTDQKTHEPVGTFYLDLHPREGKYGHAMEYPIRPGCARDNGRQLPVATMVANFTKPTADKPSLLYHNEVVTYFHELGHVMHEICGKTKWSRFHGTNVEGDFVEAPSQMLENWCWDVATLQSLSSHFEHPDQRLSVEVIERMVRAKNQNAGLVNLRQLFFGFFDMTVHTSNEPVDTVALWAKMREDITLIPHIPGSCPAAAFGHIIGGYDSGYYGYLWSLVFAADMFASRFKKEGVLNPPTGMAYRTEILAPGGSRDSMDSLVVFLSRKPEMDAFLESIGLQATR